MVKHELTNTVILILFVFRKLDTLYIEIPEVYSYIFRNAFFCLEYADDECSPFNQNETDINIVVLRKTYRKGHIYPRPYHTKYICNPRHVLEAGNHLVSKFLSEDTDVDVLAPTGIALMHHYRHCNGLPTYCDDHHNKMHCTESIVVDHSIYTYKNELVDRITNTRKRLNQNCVST